VDQGLGYLFAAFFVAWLVLLLYLFSLAGRVSSLRRELTRLEEQRKAAPGRPEQEE
jgi:CcmD family protein